MRAWFFYAWHKIYPIQPTWHDSAHKMLLFSFLFFCFVSFCFSTYWPSRSFLYATENAQEGLQREKKQQIPHVCFRRQMLIFKTIHSLNKLKQARNQDGGLGRPRGIWNRVTIARRPVVQSRDTHALEVYSSLVLQSGPDRYAPVFTLQLAVVHPECPADWTSCSAGKRWATSKCARQIKRLIDVNSAFHPLSLSHFVLSPVLFSRRIPTALVSSVSLAAHPSFCLTEQSARRLSVTFPDGKFLCGKKDIRK